MKKKRLLKLADLLESDTDWGKSEVQPVIDCGTTACAIGLACISGVFEGDGLDYEYRKDEKDFIPMYGEAVGWWAVTEFFDISYDTAEDLFQPYKYKFTTGATAELAVASKIRKFVETDSTSD